MVMARKFGYATEDLEEWRRVSREYRHTVFTDRINVPRMDPITGTLQLHMVSGTWERGEEQLLVRETRDDAETVSNKMVKTYKLNIASMPCVCTTCRGDDQETCIFKRIRNERVEWMHESLANEQRTATTAEERQSFLLIFVLLTGRLQTILAGANMLGADGSKKITVKIMQDYLRLRSQPTSGRKHELAKRIIDSPRMKQKCRYRDLLLRPII